MRPSAGLIRQARKRVRDAEADGSAPRLGAQLGGPGIGDGKECSDDSDGDDRAEGEEPAGNSDSGFDDDAASGGSGNDDEDTMDGVDMLQSSDDDEDGPSAADVRHGAARAAAEPSHAGMALAGKRRMAQGTARGAGELDGLSVQEQEALALRMLRKR